MIFRNRPAFLYAAFVGACMFLSYGLAVVQLGDNYKGVVPMYYDDGTLYRARTQEVLDGHFVVASPYLHEYKEEPTSIMFSIGEWFYVLPALAFGISAVQWAYFFLLPVVLFVLVYFFIRKLLGEETRDSELTAIAAGALVLFGFEFVDYHYVLSLLQGGPPAALVWTRPVNPIIGALQLFGLLLLLWRLVDGQRKYIFFIGALAASMVGYYFAWGTGLSILGALFLIHIAKKQYTVARDIFYAGALSFLLVSPYLYSALSAFGGEEGVRASLRTGMFYTHEFVVNTVLLLATIIAATCFAFAYRKGTWRAHEKSWIFIGALLIAGWVVFNQQVITGRQIWHHHFVQYTVPFLYIVILATGYLSIREVAPRLWKAAVILVIALMCAHGLYTAATLYKTRIDDFRAQQEYAPLVSWLREREGEPCVVFPIEDETGKFINAYTHCDAYISASVQHGVPLDRLLHNYLALLRMRGLEFEDATEYFLANEAEVRGYMYDDWHQLFGHGADDWFLAKVQYLTAAYALFMQEPLDTQLRKYRVDFFVSRAPLLESTVKQLPGLGTPQTIGTFHLYEFK